MQSHARTFAAVCTTFLIAGAASAAPRSVIGESGNQRLERQSVRRGTALPAKIDRDSRDGATSDALTRLYRFFGHPLPAKQV